MSDSAEKGDSLLGLTVDQGRYKIIKLIGEGGMGRVFQALQMSMNRMVALKVLRAQLATDEHLLARFQQEALSVSKLRHPNTITVFDYGRTEDGYLFIAMELLGGESLADILSEQGALEQGLALHIVSQVVGAVAEAHQFGIVHRDLKPENIQIDKVGNDPSFAKVLDFGIAKILHGDDDQEQRKTLTMAGTVFGTPHYMSPEQVHGVKVDHRTDIYALGVILFELLAGSPPFEGATPMAIMMAQASKPPPDIRDAYPDLDVLDSVAELINACLVKPRDDRLGTASEMLEILQEAQQELGDPSSSSRRFRLDARILDSAERSSERVRRRSDRQATLTPDHKGQVTSKPPGPIAPPDDDDDDLLRPHTGSGRRLGAIAAALLLLGAGGVWLWRSGGEETEAPSEPVTISVNANEPVAPPSPEAAIEYQINSQPPGATIRRGDKVLGTTPQAIAFPAGEKPELVLELAGHKPHPFTLPGEGAAHQSIELPLVAELAKIAIELTSRPKKAEVFHNDVKLGETPMVWEAELPPGPVTLTFKSRGYQPTTHTFTAGEQTAPVLARLARAGSRRRAHHRPKIDKPKIDKPKADKPKIDKPKIDKPKYQRL